MLPAGSHGTGCGCTRNIYTKMSNWTLPTRNGMDRAPPAVSLGAGSSANHGLAGSVRKDALGEYSLPAYCIVPPPGFHGPELPLQVAGQKALRVRRGRVSRPSAPTFGHREEPGAIDSQSVKTADMKIEGRKRHMIEDAEPPTVQRVREASVQDRDGAVPLIRELVERFPTVTRV